MEVAHSAYVSSLEPLDMRSFITPTQNIGVRLTSRSENGGGQVKNEGECAFAHHSMPCHWISSS